MRSEEKCGRINEPTILDDEDEENRKNEPPSSSSSSSSATEPNEVEIRDELEETSRDFGFEELLTGIVHRAKHGQVSITLLG